MKIKVNNLGAIRTADIDLSKKLTIFCGPNNTGKTYLSYVIYALLTASKQSSYIAKSIPQESLRELFEYRAIEINIIPEEVVVYKKKLTEHVLENLDTVFGISEEKAKSFFKDFQLQFTPSLEECSEKISTLEFVCKMNLGSLSFAILKREPFKIVVKPSDTNDYTNEPVLPILRSLIYTGVLGLIATYPILGVSIFPVERMSVYTFKKELSINRNILVDQILRLEKNEKINPFDFVNQRSKRYPIAISRNLDIANDLTEIQKNRGDYFELAETIEKDLLGGHISITKEGDVMFTSDKTSKSKIMPIHMAASVIKSISSLVIYLKHLAHKGDLIIIDEPEMNLHPNSQILLVHIFAKLLNSDLKLLISTHSDYIIREFNNLIMASSLNNEDLISKHRYTNDILVNKDDVNVYYFQYKTKKNVDVEAVDVTDTGFAISSIDDTIDKQNRIAEDLYFNLKYSDND